MFDGSTLGRWKPTEYYCQFNDNVWLTDDECKTETNGSGLMRDTAKAYKSD